MKKLVTLCAVLSLAYIAFIAVAIYRSKPAEPEPVSGYRYANDRPDLPYTYNQYGYCKTYIK